MGKNNYKKNSGAQNRKNAAKKIKKRRNYVEKDHENQSIFFLKI